MSAPNLPSGGGTIPGDSPTAGGFAAFAAKSGEDWQNEQKPPVHGSFSLIGGFRGLLFAALQGLAAGPLQFLSDLFNIRWTQADTTQATANAAQSAATAANNSVQALITGGSRTIYTSSTTWNKATYPNAVKFGFLVMGSGGAGPNAQYNDSTAFGMGGGYAYIEVPASGVPAGSHSITVAGPKAGGSGTTPGTTSIGSIISSPIDGTGSVISVAGYQNMNNSTGGNGGRVMTAGSSTPLASGGSAGPTAGTNGGSGGNASTTGVGLAGGGGGGGGFAGVSGTLALAGTGGNGGFPSGGSGAGGRTGFGSENGGTSGGGLAAVIVWT